MAVPFIVRVLPYGAVPNQVPLGPTGGGALVEIYGGNFRLAQPPIDSLDPLEEPRPTVRVTFTSGGFSSVATRVAVARSNLLRVVTPPTPLPFDTTRVGPSPAPEENDARPMVGNQGWVDVVVENLDDNGDPIPGESAVAPVYPGQPGAYVYTYPGVTSVSESTTTRIVDALLQLWRRDLLANTLTHQSIEYDSDIDTLERVDIARLPAIVLIGPRTTTSRMYEEPGPQVVDPITVPGAPPEVRYMITRMPYTLDFAFDVIGMTNSRQVALNLMHAAIDLVHRVENLEIPRDPNNLAAGNAVFDFDFEAQDQTFGFDRDPNESDLHIWRGSIVIRGVQIERISALGDGAVDAVLPVEVINVDYCAS